MSDSLVRHEGALVEEEVDDDDDETGVNLPPGRLHATRVPKRLSGSTSSLPNLMPASIDSLTSSTATTPASTLHIPPNLNFAKQLHRHSRGSSYDGGGSSSLSQTSSSRSRSPSLHNKSGDRTPTTMDANSSVSSLDELRELTIQDILTDRAGLSDSTDWAKKEKALLHNNFHVLPMPPVAERMTDEALEDCHAFSDVRSYSSRNSSAKGVDANGDVSIALEPLNECDEFTDDDLEDIDEDVSDDDPDHYEQHSHPQVILTNLNNFNLEHGMLQDGESEPLDLEPGSQTG